MIRLSKPSLIYAHKTTLSNQATQINMAGKEH